VNAAATASDVDSISATLDEVGFAVIPSRGDDIREAYDRAVATADPIDASVSSSTRVHDFVNRGRAFDRFWLDPLMVAVCERVFRCPFKLSSFQARTVNPGADAQPLHVDLACDDDGPTLVGFIWMIDEFCDDNGATRFIPRGRRAAVRALGRRGSLVLYDGGVLHGYGDNRSRGPRRSLQGAWVRRSLPQAIDQRGRLRSDTVARLDARARYLLDVV
jgi:ectoine hydroxylase-related dioxygenase (phytanoyl-CoA dioxygenase family)